MGEEFPVSKIQNRIDVLHIVLAKNVVLFGKCRLHSLRRRGHRRTRICTNNVHQGRMQNVIHREEDYVQRFLAMLFLNQVVDVRNSDLRWETGIDRTTARASTIKF